VNSVVIIDKLRRPKRFTREEKIARVKAIRDAALLLIRDKGDWYPVKSKRGTEMTRGYRSGDFSMLLATPFQKSVFAAAELSERAH
jgi:hypothetical protein